MESLKLSITITEMSRKDAVDVVNNIQNNLCERVIINGLHSHVISCEDVQVVELTLQGEDNEPINVIANKTKSYNFIESKSLHINVGDAFMVSDDFYSVVHFEERWFLYSFAGNKALYSYDNIKTSEQLRETVDAEYENNKFYKRI